MVFDILQLVFQIDLQLLPSGSGVDLPGIRTLQDNAAPGADVLAMQRSGIVGIIWRKLTIWLGCLFSVFQHQVVPVHLTTERREFTPQPVTELDER